MTFKRKPVLILLLLSLSFWVCFLTSCSEQRRLAVRSFPSDTPFVAHNRIELKGNLPKDEKNRLLNSLENYWDDSLVARKVQRFGFFYSLRNPPIFDTMNIRSTILFMNGYLNSQGYYYATYKDTFFVTEHKARRFFLANLFSRKEFPIQKRTTVIMKIDPGKNIIIDSLSYLLNDSNLQRLALANVEATVLKKGKPYSKELVASELNRLVTIYRQNGYYQLSRDNLLAEADTTDKALMRLTVDPFELAERLAEASERQKRNPIIDLSIYERGHYYRKNFKDTSFTDTAALKQYYIGNIYYYPETKATEIPDSLINKPDFRKLDRRWFTIYEREGKFRDRPFRDHSYMRRGSMYNEELYYKTMTNFSNIGAWGQVDSRTVVRGDSLDFHIFLSPNIKYNITYDLEASRNTGDVIGASNLFGIASSVTLRNRNVAKRAIQAVTSLRTGVEMNLDPSADLFQTTQASANQRFAFPRFIFPINIPRRAYKLDARQTVFNINGAYLNRKDFYQLRSFVTSWGYEAKKKNKLYSLKLPNVELYSLDTLEGLRNAFKTNPLLRTAFNTGSVISIAFSYTVTYPGRNNPAVSNFFRFSAEEAGGITGRIKSLQDRIYQYVKFDAEYKKSILYRKTTLALRAYGGAGINYSGEGKFGKTLPFFKQFFAGGPNSMRAWGLRQLGLGSSLLSDTSGSFRDRYGDLQLELNAEYRYKLATIGSIQVAGALFTDIGNVWNIKNDPDNPKSVFNLSRLPNDIAIAIGTGIRFDFNYFLIRVDGGLKLKDPARLGNNGWLDFSNFTWTNDEFKIIDATDASGQRLIKRNNFAIQLGIGLPF